jgi:hypothetical protein
MSKKHYITVVEKIERWHHIEVEIDDSVDVEEVQDELSECSTIGEARRRLNHIVGLTVDEFEECARENTEIEIM